MKICIVLSTRPEIIKLASLIKIFKKNKINFFLINTNQHYINIMSKVFFRYFKIPKPKYNIKASSSTYGGFFSKTIKGIENILSKGIDSAKFTSINFKDQTDPESGKQLVEFRIGGGDDYHLDFNKVAKAVIRYATTMTAGYSAEGLPRPARQHHPQYLLRPCTQEGWQPLRRQIWQPLRRQIWQIWHTQITC